MKKPNAGVCYILQLKSVEVPHGEESVKESKERFFLKKIKNILF